MRRAIPLVLLISACGGNTLLSRVEVPGADAGVIEARDAEPLGAPDAVPSAPDAAAPDAAVPDAEVPDAEVPDAEVPDAEAPADAAASDAAPHLGPRYPVVLLHGWASTADGLLGFARIGQVLVMDGLDVHVTSVPPYDVPAARADALAPQIDQLLISSGAPKVNLIAHSMGGLDARHLISVLGYGDRVASLTMVGTPNKGSQIADLSTNLMGASSSVAIDALVRLFGPGVAGNDPHVRDSLAALSEAAAIDFERLHPDDPRVHYQSWAGLSNLGGIPGPHDAAVCGTLLFNPQIRDLLDPALVGAAPIVGHALELRPNDGMVTVDSAKHGRFRGCIPADHADEVGAFDDQPPDPITGFNVFDFYRGIISELAADGY